MDLAVDPRNPKAAALAGAVVEGLRARGSSLAVLDPGVTLVVGGDGWMLRCVHDGGPARVYLGLNAGHLGFLLNDAADLDGLVARLAAGAWSAHTFPRLRMEALGTDGTTRVTHALNDLYLERSSGQTAHLALEIDGEPLVERLVCDGIIVATALGSTAYSLSAGGVPCHPALRATLITPICPHAPRLSPVLLPPEATVRVTARHPERRPVRAVADGVDLGPVSAMTAGPGDAVSIAFLDGHAFTRTLVGKVLRS
jgi:NAD+ kinase